LSTKNKRHKEIIKKIQNIMKEISNDVLIGKQMPSLEISKIFKENDKINNKSNKPMIGKKIV